MNLSTTSPPHSTTNSMTVTRESWISNHSDTQWLSKALMVFTELAFTCAYDVVAAHGSKEQIRLAHWLIGR
jgi:hypothetical protein